MSGYKQTEEGKEDMDITVKTAAPTDSCGCVNQQEDFAEVMEKACVPDLLVKDYKEEDLLDFSRKINQMEAGVCSLQFSRRREQEPWQKAAEKNI